ncbi:PLD nuclease N-terminal domain-containing protein [Actinoplanes sp. NPDC026623]|uniref:PLD nuclease N-terminal domain-containing protein n=1 Tax=Actinoplanes sp. NPDC026623 TaxID=3155610 RepID=UPI0033F091CA
MVRLYSLFALIDLALLVIALIDCLSAEEFQIRALPRIAWVFIILLFSPIGAIAWFIAGRPARAVQLSNGTTWRPGNGFPESQRPRPAKGPLAPDDDPEFLRSLATSLREDESMMKRWEADLRRREQELRKQEPEEK